MAKTEPGTERQINKQRPVKKNEKPVNKKLRLTVFVLSCVVTFLACFIISYSYILKYDKNKDVVIDIPAKDRIAIQIPLGSSTADIAKILKKNGIIHFPTIFRIMSNLNGYDSEYKSGTHIVSKSLSYDELMRVLTSNPSGIKVTIPEGYNLQQIAEKLAQEKLVDKDKFLEVAENETFDFKFVNSITRDKNRLEGYLFPDTYEFDISTGEKEIIRRMLNNFDAKFPTSYYARAEELGMTVDEIIILASIIEKEAQDPDEMPRIASVFYNRLSGKYNIERKLESCATIQYIYYQQTGKIKQVITEEDTKIVNPYNTYLYEGLPPGPISCPGEAAIKAALYPAETSYLYFVAKGDGTHYFSRTLAEHQAAMKRYGVSK